MDAATDTESAATTVAADASGGSLSGGGSPESTMHSPMSNCSLDKFMEALGTLSPGVNDHHQLHLGKRQSLIGIGRRSSCGSTGSDTMDAVVSCEGVADDGDESGDRLGERSDTFSAIPCSSAPGSSDWHTPRHHHFTRARRPSPSKQHINEVKHEPMDASAAGLGLRKGGAAVAVAAAAASSAAAGQVAGGSLARTPMASTKRKRSYAQLASSLEDNGAPSPFPAGGGSKDSSRALSNSLLTVHQDGAYLQVTFDPSHRFASEEDPPDSFLPTPGCVDELGSDGQKEGRKDIDQALSLLQLSGGSGSSQELNENVVPGSASSAPSPSGVGAASTITTPSHGHNHDPNNSSNSYDEVTGGSGGFDRHWPFWPGSTPSHLPTPHLGAVTAAAAEAAAGRVFRGGGGNGPIPAARDVHANDNLSNASTRNVLGNTAVARRAGARALHTSAMAGTNAPEVSANGKGRGAKIKQQLSQHQQPIRAAKPKTRARGGGGGQRPAVQAPVSTPQGTTGGGPGSFCSKPEALSQLDTSQSELMVLDADLWIVRERGDICTSTECIYKDKSSGVSSRRHYHATCEHRHKGGPKGGMIFHHHQLEKIQKHQRAHIRILHKKTPAEAVLSEANVEPYLPNAWSEEETGVLAHLVRIYGPTHWGTIAAGVATKSETQCMLHWRYSLNGNETVKGTGTWQPVEDERMLSLVQIFGQRWSTVAEHMPGRLAKQCRERYLNNLDPDLRRGAWSRDEDEKLLHLRGQHNLSFAKIAEKIEGRSYNDVKNRWSQISRQIAALKRASSGHSKDGKPVDLGTSGGGTNTHPNSPQDVGANSVFLNKAPLGSATNTNTNMPTTAVSSTATATDSGPASAPAVRYKVCMEAGIPTLREVPDDAEDVSGGASGAFAPSASSGYLPPVSSYHAVPTTPSMNNMVSAGQLLHHMVGPPSYGADIHHNIGPDACPEVPGLLKHLYGPNSGPIEGVGPVSVPSSMSGADSVFGPPMTDAEAASIAAGPFMGFPTGGNDMRVSI